jgi:hypothetical protein
MSYLLGYQKWRKLHESAKYRKIYEQAFNKDTGVQFIIVGGTSPTPINDAKLHTETNLPNGTGVALYEISVKDALLNNFSTATKIKDLKVGAMNEQDQFQIVDGENIIMQTSGQGEGKAPIIFTYTPKSTYKIRFSGNGVLALFRAVAELESLKASVNSLDLEKHSGNICIYMNYKNAPTKLSKSPRFSIGTTNLLATGLNMSSLISMLNQSAFFPAIHYIASEENKNYFKGEFPTSFISVLTNSLTDKKPIYDGITLKDSELCLRTSDGLFKIEGSPYTEMDSFKNKTREEFLVGPKQSLPLPQKDKNGKRLVYLKADLKDAFQKYMKVQIDNFAKDGGTIDSYYSLKLQGLGEDLISSITVPVKNYYKRLSQEFEKLQDIQGFMATAQKSIDGQEAKAIPPVEMKRTTVPKTSGEYEEGKGAKTTAPQQQGSPAPKP